MGIVYDAGTRYDIYSTTGGSFSHTGADGPGRMAVFCLGRSAGSGGNPPAPSSLTYDGVSMLPLVANAYIEATSFRRYCVAVLPNYNPGTKTIAWNTSYANWHQAAFIMTFINVLGYRDVVSEATGNGVTSISQSATLTPLEWIVAGFIGANWSPGGGQTDRTNADGMAAATKESISGGSTSISWSGGSALVAAGGVVLTPMLFGCQVTWIM